MWKLLKLLLPFLFLLFSLYSCDKIADWYIGIPLQPDFTSNNFKSGMNVFGVIRLDNTGNYNNSFVYIQQVIPAVGDTITDLEITDAIVQIKQASDTGDIIFPFSFSNPDSVFRKMYYRPGISFAPQAGKVYRLLCEAAELPLLEGDTRVPQKPVVVENSLVANEHKLSFQIQTDSTCHLLDIYLFANDISISQRIIPDETGKTDVVFDSETDISHGSISFFAYDRNLAIYYVTSNVSVNLNKFKKPFSTVQGGYGVFGSINSATVDY